MKISELAGSPGSRNVVETPGKELVRQQRSPVDAELCSGRQELGKQELGTQDYATTSQSVGNTTPLPSNNLIGIRAGSEVQAWIRRLGSQIVVGADPAAPTARFVPGSSPFMGLRGDQVIGWDDGVCASVSPSEVPRQPFLPAEPRAWETEFVEMFCHDTRAVVRDYQKLVGDSHIYEVDLAKRCFPAYGRAREPGSAAEHRLRAEGNVALHQVATAITKLAFLERLDQLAELPDDHPDKLVLATSGGCAAGKGALVDILKVQQPDLHFGAVWDAAGENNALENPWLLRECSARGISVIFGYVHGDPATNIKGVLHRALVSGRMVDVVPFTYSYLDGAKNMAAFLESPEYREAHAAGLASCFGLTPGQFNRAAVDDPQANPYPDAAPLPFTDDGGIEVPLHGEPREILDAVLDVVDEQSTAMTLADSIMISALSGLGRFWPRQRRLLEGHGGSRRSRHV